MKKIEFVYNYINNNVKLEEIKLEILEENKVGIDASQIEEELGIVRNNASTLLNDLCKQNRLIKIKGRPVRFVPTNIIEKLINESQVKREYSIDELKDILLKVHSANDQKNDPFKILIGYNSSLKTQVDQAKAAIVYPPNGLHTLILGPSGVGKTTFAKTMYEYAKTKQKMPEDKFPFVSLNCSDYYNNPQLLLSQLFGHIKGAFTGADADKAGLVEKADGGILFLDEVHRLPPDGQEILFYLMDKGEYHRLGETGNTRKSDVLIIAATTEDPQEVLLTTFLRRIPVIITLPPLKDKSITERFEIIESLFIDEAIRIKNKLNVSPEVLKALNIYECKGNIGQLKSDIKLLCAKAFLKYLQKKDELKIEFDMLSQNIKNSIFRMNKLNIETQEYLNTFKEDLIIYPSKEKYKKLKSSEENIYIKIADKLERMKEKGLSDKDIYIEISKGIDDYYRDVIKKFHYKNFNIRELYKVIDKEIVDFTFELVTLASDELEREFDSGIMFGLAFHLSALLKRIKLKEPIVHQKLLKIKELYREEYEVASLIVKKISEKFNVNIPIDENGFIAVLLANNKKENVKEDKIGIIVIAHGVSTASSIANVCNKLLNSDFVKAIDMPLEKSVEETYHKVLSMVKTIDKGKGIMLLVDMGSLKSFGERIIEETGIITRTIDRVSTPVVLEILRKVMYKNSSIDEIYNSFNEDNIHSTNTNINKEKEKAIMTICATGKGTSLMMQKVLSSLLEKIERTDIEIIPFDYSAIETNSSEYKKACRDYEIIASVGNINPKIDIPYYSIDDILNKSSRNKFIKFVESKAYKAETNDNKSCYEVSREMLEEFVMFINPKIAITYIEKFINALDIEGINKNDSLITSLTIHIGCMLERIITKNRVVFEGLEEYINENLEEFNMLKKAIKLIEEPFKVNVSDDEICYILKVIKNS